MPRMAFIGKIVTLGVVVWIGAVGSAHGQDRAGAAGMGAAVAQPAPGAMVQPPGGGVIPPAGGVIPPGGAGVGVGGGLAAPAAGNLGIGTIPITPPTPPIGYYAPRPAEYNMGKFFYYPYYYYPHSYWPTETCKWPERPGQAYMRPPAYMTYPPFMEPNWRYEWYTPQHYYRGFHFWLDQF